MQTLTSNLVDFVQFLQKFTHMDWLGDEKYIWFSSLTLFNPSLHHETDDYARSGHSGGGGGFGENDVHEEKLIDNVSLIGRGRKERKAPTPFDGQFCSTDFVVSQKVCLSSNYASRRTKQLKQLKIKIISFWLQKKSIVHKIRIVLWWSTNFAGILIKSSETCILTNENARNFYDK